MFSIGTISITIDDILEKVSEGQILNYYIGITNIPIRICSPFHPDSTPSLGFYERDGKILWNDFGLNKGGDIWSFFRKLWNMDLCDVLYKINKDINHNSNDVKIRKSFSKGCSISKNKIKDIKVKVRNWHNIDNEYWNNFGISIEWLKSANVYPVSRVFIYKENDTIVLPADKLSYAYVENKDNKQMIKIYQPLNIDGYKWTSGFDKSVISLWTKLPATGNIVCICSSLKDSICLWENTKIPAISPQGEGYGLSNTVVNELKKRFKYIFILYDNDKPGIADSQKLSASTGFINLELPKINGAKDISDLYKTLQNKNDFKEIIYKLFKKNIK